MFQMNTHAFSKSHAKGLLSRAGLVCALLVSGDFGTQPLEAADVRFWLSNADTGPVNSTINVLPNVTTSIDVWARPAPNFTLTAFSLNLVAIVAEQASAVNFQEVIVHNPLLQSPQDTYRHQLVFDSTVEVESPFGPVGINIQPDRIEGFSGLTFFNDPEDLQSGGGIGPDCLDALCGMASGSPAWRIATIEFLTGAVGDSSELFLEIGTQGIWHINEDPTDTSALFGVGLYNQELHGWSTDPADIGMCNPGPDCRNQHKGLPDAIINVVSSITDADFDDDNDVDGADFFTWQRGYDLGTTHAEGDANGDGMVVGNDLAIWHDQFSSAGALGGISVPEPSSLALLTVILGCVCSRQQRRL